MRTECAAPHDAQPPPPLAAPAMLRTATCSSCAACRHRALQRAASVWGGTVPLATAAISALAHGPTACPRLMPRNSTVSVKTKAAQLWNVGHGLPLDALKKGSIVEWSCAYRLSSGEVLPLIDALIKNSSLARLHLASAVGCRRARRLAARRLAAHLAAHLAARAHARAQPALTPVPSPRPRPRPRPLFCRHAPCLDAPPHRTASPHRLSPVRGVCVQYMCSACLCRASTGAGQRPPRNARDLHSSMPWRRAITRVPICSLS